MFRPRRGNRPSALCKPLYYFSSKVGFPNNPFHSLQNRPLSTQLKEPVVKPLRILFCGSDKFSCASLESLFIESQRQQSQIRSIDVVCREGKPAGRGLKSIRNPEIVGTASKLGLVLHQIKTFTGWELPQFPDDEVPKINLIVAVSFGLKIPARILSASEYSGINLHPSLLPLYKGPAPLQWTILNGDRRTGMSLQTLHPTSFDEGIILDQTPWPGLELPENYDYHAIESLMMNLGPKMLVDGIRNQLYERPYQDVSWAKKGDPASTYARAPKVGPSERFLPFRFADSSRITRISRAFSATWAMASSSKGPKEQKKIRLTFHEKFEVLDSASEEELRASTIPAGLPYQECNVADAGSHGKSGCLLINTVDGKTIRILRMKVEGDKEMSAYEAACKHSLLGQSVRVGSQDFLTFHTPLY